MINKIQEAVIKGMDMHVTTGNNLMKLGKIVEINTDNLNLLATRLLKLEQRIKELENCLLYTSPSPRDRQKSRMPSSA